jgi:predicted nucleic acid-binding protein
VTASSSNPARTRALDAMVLVYALLEGHPASAACEQMIRERKGWFTTSMTLLEVKAVLTKVYGVEATEVTQKLTQVVSGPLAVLPVDAALVLAAMSTADRLRLDLTDAVLLETALAQQATNLATDDGRLADSCRKLGLAPEEPFGDELRGEVAAWESAHLPAKGLPRVLGRIERWLVERDEVLAQDFRSQTGGNSHLP